MNDIKQVSFRLKTNDIDNFRDFCEFQKITAAEGFTVLMDKIRLDSSAEGICLHGSDNLIFYKNILAKATNEIDARIKSGENILFLYVSIYNENKYISNVDPMNFERINYLETMLFLLEKELVKSYMAEAGWELNENGRCVKAKE